MMEFSIVEVFDVVIAGLTTVWRITGKIVRTAITVTCAHI